MDTKTEKTKKILSNEAEVSLRTTFGEYIKDNEIDRNKLVNAINTCDWVRDRNNKKIKFSIYDLDDVIADIDSPEDTTNKYRLRSLDDLDVLLKPYSDITSKYIFSPSEKLIYAALLLDFDAVLTNFQVPHPATAQLTDRLMHFDSKTSTSEDYQSLTAELEALNNEAKRLFFCELLNTDAQVQAAPEMELLSLDDKIQAAPETVFTKIDNFFNTPSLARDLVTGIGVGLLAAGGVAGFLLLTAGTAGIGPLVLGTTAAAALGTAAATGLSLGAIGLGVAGVITALFAGVGALLRSETPDNSEKQTISLNSSQEPTKKQFSGLFDKNSLKPEKSPIVIPNSDSKPTSISQPEISEIKQQGILDKLEGLKEYDILVAKFYIENINRGIEIEKNLGKIEGIINDMPATYSAKQHLIDYVDAIREEFKPTRSPTL